MNNIYDQSLTNYSIWYHGTTINSAKRIKRGIKLNYANKFIFNIKDVKSLIYHTYDFGPGFYLTACPEQAKKWAKSVGDINSNKENHPALVKINLSKFLKHDHVLRFNHPNNKFEQHVFYCRITGKYFPRDLNKYTAVFGPMIDGHPGAYIPKIRKQYFSSHMGISKFYDNKSLIFKNLINPNVFYPEKNQICLIDSKAIKHYIKTEDISWEALS